MNIYKKGKYSEIKILKRQNKFYIGTSKRGSMARKEDGSWNASPNLEPWRRINVDISALVAHPAYTN